MKNIILLLLSILLLACIVSCGVTNSKSKEPIDKTDKAVNKPNIVFIVVDDLGYSDVGYMNQKEGIQTPNIDELAKNGMVFTNAYAAAPVCSPTRAALITGKSPASLKLTCHIPGVGMEKYFAKLNYGKKLKEAHFIDHLPTKEVSIAAILKQEGYATAYMGKWHLGGGGSIYTEDGIVNADYLPTNYGFDSNIGGNAYGQPASYFSPYKNGNIKDGPDGEYLTDRLGDEVVQFIEKNKDKPFFLNFATYSVHTPLVAPDETVNKYDGNKYFAMIEKLDQNVGKVMDRLQSSNLLENTIVIFYSDNGGLWGNPPLKGKKGTLNEGGIRVPMIASWPGKIEAGSSCNIPVTSIDFFPTIAQLAGVSPSIHPQLEGKSLVPLFHDESQFIERSLFWHFPHHRKEGLSMAAAIRKGKWKYIYEFETQKEYLYNLEDDIGEQFNLSTKLHKQTLELSNELKHWQLKVNAEIPEPNK